ncbi:hypothetical protein bcere0028_27560 [Bacillus cereus AH1271]|nr:hypothetical protein bcere0028_27560 [Bacillus cereus AH1271]
MFLYNCIFVHSFLYNKNLYKGTELTVTKTHTHNPKIINEEKMIHIEGQKNKR